MRRRAFNKPLCFFFNDFGPGSPSEPEAEVSTKGTGVLDEAAVQAALEAAKDQKEAAAGIPNAQYNSKEFPYVAKMRGDFGKSNFILFDNGGNPRDLTGDRANERPRCELMQIGFKRQMTIGRSPKSIELLVPAIDEEEEVVEEPVKVCVCVFGVLFGVCISSEVGCALPACLLACLRHTQHTTHKHKRHCHCQNNCPCSVLRAQDSFIHCHCQMQMPLQLQMPLQMQPSVTTTSTSTHGFHSLPFSLRNKHFPFRCAIAPSLAHNNTTHQPILCFFCISGLVWPLVFVSLSLSAALYRRRKASASSSHRRHRRSVHPNHWCVGP